MQKESTGRRQDEQPEREDDTLQQVANLAAESAELWEEDQLASEQLKGDCPSGTTLQTVGIDRRQTEGEDRGYHNRTDRLQVNTFRVQSF